MINHNNYQIYAIDYIEGRLNNKIKKEFELFLQQNPEIREEILELKNFKLEQENNINYTHKHKLKKSSIPELTYTEELIIANIEEIATPQQKQELKKLLKINKQANKEYQLYKKTKVIPPIVIFPNKNKLKKPLIPLYTHIYNVLAYAAIFLILFTIFSLFKKTEKQTITSILPQKTEDMEILLPSTPTIVSNIYRPVVANTKAKSLKKNYKTNNIKVKQKFTNKKHIKQDLNSTTPISSELNIEERIASKNFYLNPNVIDTLPFQYNFTRTYKVYIILEQISSKADNKIKNILNQKGIKISRNEFVFKIKNKTYGFAIVKN